MRNMGMRNMGTRNMGLMTNASAPRRAPLTRVLAAGLAASALAGAAAADVTDGDLAGTVWVTEGGASRVKFEMAEDGTLQGRLVWLRREEERGIVQLDENNPDAGLQSRPLKGVAFVSGFSRDGATWKDGEIYNPNNGKTYASKIRPGDTPEELKVAGCVRVLVRICDDQTWTRYVDPSDAAGAVDGDVITSSE